MNIFKFKFTKAMTTLIVLSLLLVFTGLAVNIYRFTLLDGPPAYYVLSLSITTLITVILIVVIVSILFFTRYIIDDTKVTTRFGIIKSHFLISDIKQITHFKHKDKLVCYFEDRYTVIVIDKKFFDMFINAVRENNNKIIYDIRSDDKDI